jgi:hypothetical protein
VTSTLLTPTIVAEALDPTICLCEVGYRICRGVLQAFARMSGVSPSGLPTRQFRLADPRLLGLCLSRRSRLAFLSTIFGEIREAQTTKSYNHNIGSNTQSSRCIHN